MKTIIFVDYQIIIVMKIVNYMQKLAIVKENAYYHIHMKGKSMIVEKSIFA
jgi:hypothetical protein